MQAENWSIKLLRELVYQFGNNPAIIEEIFSCRMGEVKTKEFTLAEAMGIADRLGVSLTSLIDSDIDWKVVKLKYLTPNIALPDEYQENSGTYMSTIRSVISFISFKYNQETANSILQQLQLDPAALLNDNLKVNIKFVNHLFKILVDKMGFNKDDMNILSIMVHRYSMRNSVVAMAKVCKTDGDILRTMISNASKYEQNFDYWLEEENNNTIIHSRSRYELDDPSSFNGRMNEPHVWFKISSFKNITGLMGRNAMNISDFEIDDDKGFQTLKIRVQDTDKLSSLRANHIH
jgi:hypothetical protein